MARLLQRDSFTAKHFYLEDQPRTLFPLATNTVLVTRGASELSEFAGRITAGQGSFLPQRRVYANKDALHLRRTVKLDAVAEYYLYELVHRNRARFRKPHRKLRRHFGYQFEAGRPVPASRSYSDFKAAVWTDTFETEEFISFDVSSYFNGIYHHDLHAWFAGLQPKDPTDVPAFGKFLGEINAGRSLDCLPQGLYPTKMIGNDFLRFIEESANIRARRIARFMDDVYLFDDNQNTLQADFAEVQRLLGLKGLSINSSKTQVGGMPRTDQTDEDVGELKKRLLRRRRNLILTGYEDFDDGSDQAGDLEEDEIEFIVGLLRSGNLEEDDAELILVVMRDHVGRIEDYLPQLAKGFPHLAKNFYGLCREADDMEAIADIVLDVALQGGYIGEYQLFWFGMMLESYLMNTLKAPEIISALYRHPSASDISRAKILEIPDLRYGLPEMRETFLREGRSDWQAWASAAGSLALNKQARNYLLAYFANGSEMNQVIAGILQKA